MKDFTQSNTDMELSIEEAAEFLFVSALQFRNTKAWRHSDDGSYSCETVCIPVSAIKRLREAISRQNQV